MISNRSPIPDCSICVLIPVLNEEENLVPTVDAVRRALSGAVGAFEIIIVDDGSDDRTGEIADRLARDLDHIRVFHNPRTLGIGYAYRLGYEKTNCDYFVYIPGDNAWPGVSYSELFSRLGQANIVVSYVLNPEIRPFGRRLLSSLYTAGLNALFGREMRYYNGLTIYPVSFLRTGPATTFGFGFQAEVLLKALTAGLSYTEVGLAIDDRAVGKSKALRVRNIVSVIGNIAGLWLSLRWKRR